MRHEEDVRASVAERAVILIDELERGIVSLSGSGDHRAAVATIVETSRRLKTMCTAVQDFAPMIATLAEFELLMLALRPEHFPLSGQAGGVGLHLVSVLKSGMQISGTDTRTARLVPRLLQDLGRVMVALRKKHSLEPGSESEARKLELKPVVKPETASVSFADQYRAVFLQDDAGLFLKIMEEGQRLVNSPVDRDGLDEFFRLVHTIKGNAMALGFDGIGRFAHALEELLSDLRGDPNLLDAVLARVLLNAAETLGQLRDEYRHGDELKSPVDQKIAELLAFYAGHKIMSAPVASVKPRASIAVDSFAEVQKKSAPPVALFLCVTIARRELLIPCEAVAEVLRNPSVMAVPGGHKGWLGVIRAGGELLPLLDPGVLLDFEPSPLPRPQGRPWIVVLQGQLAGREMRDSRFSVPVDDIGEVVEFPFGLSTGKTANSGSCTVLDIPSMIMKLDAA